jgi:hypothetical protein
MSIDLPPFAIRIDIVTLLRRSYYLLITRIRILFNVVG